MDSAKRPRAQTGGDNTTTTSRRKPNPVATTTSAAAPDGLASAAAAAQRGGREAGGSGDNGRGPPPAHQKQRQQQMPIRDGDSRINSHASADMGAGRKRKRGDASAAAGGGAGEEQPEDGPEAGGARQRAQKAPRHLATDLSMAAAAEEDRRAVDAVDARYDVQLHSVISSSKIQKKVASVLRHLDVHPYPSPPPPSEGGDGSVPRPRVSVLRARACDSGKLISIAEIAKREIAGLARHQGGGEDGPWFQYIGLGEEVRDVPRAKEKSTGPTDGRGDDGEGDEGDDFEVMQTPFERAVEGTPKKHAVAVMSLFLARVPIHELRQRYGEQTNSDTSGTTKVRAKAGGQGKKT